MIALISIVFSLCSTAYSFPPPSSPPAEALEIQGHCADQEIIARLIKQLESDRETERKKTIEELVKMGEPAVEPLIAAFGNDAYLVREGAAQAVAKIGRPAYKFLAAAAKNPEFEYEIRARAKYMLRLIGPTDREILEAAIQEGDRLRKAAADLSGEKVLSRELWDSYIALIARSDAQGNLPMDRVDQVLNSLDQRLIIHGRALSGADILPYDEAEKLREQERALLFLKQAPAAVRLQIAYVLIKYDEETEGLKYLKEALERAPDGSLIKSEEFRRAAVHINALEDAEFARRLRRLGGDKAVEWLRARERKGS